MLQKNKETNWNKNLTKIICNRHKHKLTELIFMRVENKKLWGTIQIRAENIRKGSTNLHIWQRNNTGKHTWAQDQLSSQK